MRYAEAVAAAPKGSRRFSPADLARLSRPSLRQLFEPGPSAPPLEEAAAALASAGQALFAVASALPPERGERLLRLAQRPVAQAERDAAAQRLVRGCFWALAYELEPDLWARLAEAEPISPELLAALPVDGALAVEVAAGTGRLTRHLVGRARRVLAVEPCPPLRRRLLDALEDVEVVAAFGQALPFPNGFADVLLSCTTFGPDPPLGGERVAAELERCVRPGGRVVLVGPEAPEWWVARDYSRRTFPAPLMPPADPALEDFFGTRRPPTELLVKDL